MPCPSFRCMRPTTRRSPDPNQDGAEAGRPVHRRHAGRRERLGSCANAWHWGRGSCRRRSTRVYPFVDVRTAGSLLQRRGFALPVADEETITVRYPDMFALMRELRSMGRRNALHARLRRFTPGWFSSGQPKSTASGSARQTDASRRHSILSGFQDGTIFRSGKTSKARSATASLASVLGDIGQKT